MAKDNSFEEFLQHHLDSFNKARAKHLPLEPPCTLDLFWDTIVSRRSLLIKEPVTVTLNPGDAAIVFRNLDEELPPRGELHAMQVDLYVSEEPTEHTPGEDPTQAVAVFTNNVTVPTGMANTLANALTYPNIPALSALIDLFRIDLEREGTVIQSDPSESIAQLISRATEETPPKTAAPSSDCREPDTGDNTVLKDITDQIEDFKNNLKLGIIAASR